MFLLLSRNSLVILPSVPGAHSKVRYGLPELVSLHDRLAFGLGRMEQTLDVLGSLDDLVIAEELPVLTYVQQRAVEPDHGIRLSYSSRMYSRPMSQVRPAIS